MGRNSVNYNELDPTMTTSERIHKLLKLADISQEFEHVNVDLVDHWCSMREEFGLAKLLLLIQDYVTTKTRNTNIQLPTSEADQSHKNALGMQ